MKVQFSGIVREVKDWDKGKDGQPLPADRVVSQILFMDRSTGGDVQLTFPVGHGLAVGQDVTIDAEVKPVVRNFRLGLYVIQQSAKKAVDKKQM